jgi:hypothetical protein
LSFEPGEGEAAVGVEVDLGERVGQRWARGPVAGDAGYFAAGEDLADRDGEAVGLRQEQAAEVDVENLVAWGREAAALGFEEVADAARGPAREADLGEGGRAPDDVGLRQRGEIGGGLEPDRLLGIAVVVADAAVAIGAAIGDEAGAGERGAVEAAGRPVPGRARAVPRDRRRGGGGRDREQARQQERRKREQRYAGFAVRSSVIRLKN